MQTVYKFAINSGMPGYMPNYYAGPFYAHTRKELVQILKDELEVLDYPANRLHDFGVRRMWRFVQNAKSGSKTVTMEKEWKFVG
jgi:hypothetical protein